MPQIVMRQRGTITRTEDYNVSHTASSRVANRRL